MPAKNTVPCISVEQVDFNYYDLLWFIWGSILLKLIKYTPRIETIFMSYKLHLKYHHILWGKIQYNYE